MGLHGFIGCVLSCRGGFVRVPRIDAVEFVRIDGEGPANIESPSRGQLGVDDRKPFEHRDVTEPVVGADELVGAAASGLQAGLVSAQTKTNEEQRWSFSTPITSASSKEGSPQEAKSSRPDRIALTPDREPRRAADWSDHMPGKIFTCWRPNDFRWLLGKRSARPCRSCRPKFDRHRATC
jgi:hypothetical protein